LGEPISLRAASTGAQLTSRSQTMAITNTGSSTITTLLRREGTSIPAFQTFFNYFLLNVIFTPFTMYRYGFKGWLRLVWYSGWKCRHPALQPIQ
jgi:hypothetical protein